MNHIIQIQLIKPIIGKGAVIVVEFDFETGAWYYAGEDSESKWRIELEISWGCNGAKGKTRSRRTHDHSKGTEEYQILCQRL
jgi:hypothetical protein